jgi:hypothetical protein
MHAVLALVASVLGLLGMLVHSLLRRNNDKRETESATPNVDELKLPVAMVVRRKNLRLWVSLRQLQREPR